MQESISYKTIFGPIVMRLLQNENTNETKEDREKTKIENELFEIVDDYIEQA